MKRLALFPAAIVVAIEIEQRSETAGWDPDTAGVRDASLINEPPRDKRQRTCRLWCTRTPSVDTGTVKA